MDTNVLGDPVGIVIRPFLHFFSVRRHRLTSIALFGVALDHKVIFVFGQDLPPKTYSFSFFFNCHLLEGRVDETAFFFSKADADGGKQSFGMLVEILDDGLFGLDSGGLPYSFLLLQPRRVVDFHLDKKLQLKLGSHLLVLL
jgi:hypothetical protein